MRAISYFLLGFLPLFLGIFDVAYGQALPVRFGVVPQEQRQMTICAFDEDAEAVVLCDLGQVTFPSGSLMITRHTRLKVLQERGKSRADVAIPYYVKDNFERITAIKAHTINVDEKGKLVKIQVEPKQIFDVDLRPGWREKRFAFPAVQVGSILEYTYSTQSKSYLSLENWTFATDIPTLHSEFRAQVPEGLDYRILYQGENLLRKYTDTPTNQWFLQNLPALKEEPYVFNYLDYADRLRFQLASYMNYGSGGYSGNSGQVSIMSTWEKLAEELLQDEDFTRYLNRTGQAKSILNNLIKPGDPEKAKVQAVYDHVRKVLAWNGSHRLWTEKSLAAALEAGQGNSAEINLYLVLLLREAGLVAHPMIISTREHGLIQQAYPLRSQFNHILAHVVVNGKDMVLDATSSLRPLSLLSVSHLIDQGYVLDAKNPRWVKIPAPAPTKETIAVHANLSQISKPVYSLNVMLDGYAAANARSNMGQVTEKKYAENYLQATSPDFLLNKAEVLHLKEVDQPLELKYEYYEQRPTGGDQQKLLYFQPVLVHSFQSNPFQAKNRYYPVEFGYPSNKSYIMTVLMPEGYTVEELPKNLSLKLAGGHADFTFQILQTGTMLQVLTKVNINSTLIPGNRYPELREFYDLVVAKYKEPIVLKKI